MIPDNAPAWVKSAETKNANVEMFAGSVIWRGGTWRGGTWEGGVWEGGTWHIGTWRGGTWLGGTWRGGTWRGGTWQGGTWEGGAWEDTVISDRMLYHAALIGIVFSPDGTAVAYRTTSSDGHGRHKTEWVQPQGEYYEYEALPAGSGTCVRGIHVTTMSMAHAYFGVDPTAQLWRVTFRREDLLDCDGQKARIRGGLFERIETPFFAQAAKETR